MKKFELVPMNGRKSFNHKAIVEENGSTATLYSYGAKICTLDLKTGAVEKFEDYDFSITTKTHQKTFFAFYGVKEA